MLALLPIWQVLNDWWIGVVAFGVALVATPLVRAIAYRTKIVDRPDDLLKPHGRPIAYLGGVAMCLGLLVGLASYLVVMPRLGKQWDALWNAWAILDFRHVINNPLWSLSSIAAGCVVITAMGLLDDIRSLKPRQKIYWQVVAALILIVGGVGYRVAIVFLNFVFPDVHLSPWLVVPASALLCMVMVICTCNATNLLDGLDGLCGGVTAIIAVGFLALAVTLATYGDAGSPESQVVTQEYNGLRIALCLAMVGAILGFLPYNVPPASIFMGDAGSMLLGFFVATMMAMFCREGTARWLLAAVVVYSLPIADTGLAVVRRSIAGKSIFAGDRSHLYDQLVDRGMTVTKVVVLFYFLAALSAAVGVGLAFGLRLRYSAPICAVLAIAVWVIFWRRGMIKPPPKETATQIHK